MTNADFLQGLESLIRSSMSIHSETLMEMEATIDAKAYGQGSASNPDRAIYRRMSKILDTLSDMAIDDEIAAEHAAERADEDESDDM